MTIVRLLGQECVCHMNCSRAVRCIHLMSCSDIVLQVVGLGIVVGLKSRPSPRPRVRQARRVGAKRAVRLSRDHMPESLSDGE